MTDDRQYVPKEYWEKRLGERFSIGGVGYLAFGETYNDWAYKVRAGALRDLLAQSCLDVRGKSVLDIGVGTGYYVGIFKALGAGKVTGLDITSKSVSELERRFPALQFYEADITDEKLALEGTFDIITAFDVLFHVVDDELFERAIANIARLSHEGTIVLIMDFFLENPSSVGGHQRLRTLDSYKEALRASGLKIVELKTVFTVMNPPFDIDRIKSRPLAALVKSVWWFNSNLTTASAKLGRLGRAIVTCWAPLMCLTDRFASRRHGLGPSTKLALVRTSDRDQGASER